MNNKENIKDPSDQPKSEIPLYGLVLAGGRSTRMKKDKSLLEYHGKSQTEYCFDLLSRFCKRVFVSNRKDQAGLTAHKNLPQIHDTVLNLGPLDGILSAMTKYPRAAWLALACDLPFVDDPVLETLIRKRDPSRTATAFRSVHDGLPEPLCAIYEPQSIAPLLNFVMDGGTCPRKFLIHSNSHLIEQDHTTSLENINDPEKYQSVYDSLRKSGGI